MELSGVELQADGLEIRPQQGVLVLGAHRWGQPPVELDQRVMSLWLIENRSPPGPEDPDDLSKGSWNIEVVEDSAPADQIEVVFRERHRLRIHDMEGCLLREASRHRLLSSQFDSAFGDVDGSHRGAGACQIGSIAARAAALLQYPRTRALSGYQIDIEPFADLGDGVEFRRSSPNILSKGAIVELGLTSAAKIAIGHTGNVHLRQVAFNLLRRRKRRRDAMPRPGLEPTQGVCRTSRGLSSP